MGVRALSTAVGVRTAIDLHGLHGQLSQTSFHSRLSRAQERPPGTAMTDVATC